MKEEFADLVTDFQEESNDLLEAMEISLFEIQDEGMNEENINAVFRAAHTIKGAGGLFELDYLVSFTHVAENLLDEIRNNRIEMSDEIVDLYFVVKDQLQALVDFAVENEDAPTGEIQSTSDELVEKLNFYLKGGETLESNELTPIEKSPTPEPTPAPIVTIEIAEPKIIKEPTIMVQEPIIIEKKLMEYGILKTKIKSISDMKEKEKEFNKLQKIARQLGLYNQ